MRLPCGCGDISLVTLLGGWNESSYDVTCEEVEVEEEEEEV